MYPLLTKGGILIVDDYGHWKGCKKAVDEFFSNKENIFFQQIDYSGIIGVKTKLKRIVLIGYKSFIQANLFKHLKKNLVKKIRFTNINKFNYKK